MHIDVWGRGKYQPSRQQQKCRVRDCLRQTDRGEDYCPRHERRLRQIREVARCWQS